VLHGDGAGGDACMMMMLVINFEVAMT
jgi:hypothetical protein